MASGYLPVKMDYAYLKEWMGNRPTKKVAHNTYAQRDGDVIHITYHMNEIATLSSETLWISNCGWQTLTTKERLNWFTRPHGFSIWQENNNWFVGSQQGKIGIFHTSATLDLVTMTWFGLLPLEDKTRNKAIARIKKFAKAYVTKLLDGKMETPSQGDCWFCYMDLPDQWDHLNEHIKEKYYVPSLIMRAIKFKGVSHVAEWAMVAGLHQKKPESWMLSVASDQLYASLWSYMLHCYDQEGVEK